GGRRANSAPARRPDFRLPRSIPYTDSANVVAGGLGLAETDILYEVRDRIAWITLNRPERMNALTQAMVRVEFPAVWGRFNKDEDAWVAVVSGTGERAFCTGMDVREAAETPPVPPEPGKGSYSVIRVSPRVNEVRKPVIAAVNGVCAGIG